MRQRSLVVVGLVALGLPRVAHAAEAAPARGPEIAVRLGLAVPTGDSDAGLKLSDGVLYTLPLIVEAGYRVIPTVFVGARLEYAFSGFSNSDGGLCPTSGPSCIGRNTVLGVEAIYRLPRPGFAPWFGVGGGYEWLSKDISGPSPNGGSSTFRGWQLLFAIGGDVRVTPHVALGPFFEAQAGKYDDHTLSGFGYPTKLDLELTDTAWHTWLVLGVRGAFGF
jgi:hypothetical protein